MGKKYQICQRCIMDTSASEITLDEKGICNFCHYYDERAGKDMHYDEAGKKKLSSIAEKIKEEGKAKKYDCLIGVSGGVDSTTVAYWTKKLGLKPLAVHFDNGWNSELSVSNIENTLKVLGIDLETYVVDWEEFRELQLSFLRASVANCEIPTDHAILTVLYRTAAKYGIKYIITGSNITTEAIMPESWGYDPKDLKHIKAIHREFGKIPLNSYPQLGLIGWLYYTFIKRIKYFAILNYIPYRKKDAKELLRKELGWRDYGGKHYESIYTRFFQGYILPKKFGIDKRRAHLSTLVCSGQITRNEALREMEDSPYLDEKMVDDDKEYVIKKLGLTHEEFNRIMTSPVKSYRDYPNSYFLSKKLDFLVRLVKKIITHF